MHCQLVPEAYAFAGIYISLVQLFPVFLYPSRHFQLLLYAYALAGITIFFWLETLVFGDLLLVNPAQLRTFPKTPLPSSVSETYLSFASLELSFDFILLIFGDLIQT